jgi:RNA polymerase sigma factor (sigma-70 family)
MPPMQSPAGNSALGETRSAPVRNAISGDYRRLLNTLALRAPRPGSRDPEAAAQEAFKRSWENSTSRPALEYYFGQSIPADAPASLWSLDQLLAWLHVVLRYVISEERSRIAYRLEVSLDDRVAPGDEYRAPEPVHNGADQLQLLMQRELDTILGECFPKLDSRYRSVLRMRGAGMKYDKIALRLGLKENTVATWISRGIRDLAQCVKRRTRRLEPR